MDKQYILDEIRRTATANGGEPLGRDRFSNETSVRKSDWYGVYWARWGDALKEAGFKPNQLTEGYDEAELLDALVGFIRELGHLPNEGELRIRTRRNDGFPHATTIRRLGTKSEVAVKMLSHLKSQDGFADIVAICEPLAKMPAKVRPTKAAANTADGFVYLIRSGKRYKLGATNDLATRSKAISVQMPDATKTEHVIRTDDPFGIEAYWHRRFAEKRTNGEWFELTREDVLAFKRRKTM
jgi:hypothetical protein